MLLITKFSPLTNTLARFTAPLLNVVASRVAKRFMTLPSGLSDEQEQLRDTVRKFADTELAPHAENIDKTNGFPQMREFWRKLGDLGLLGITVSEADGGSGLGYTEHLIAVEVGKNQWIK
eukprot:Ihof_evm6s385 gene=Ihof_evmTU6s385